MKLRTKVHVYLAVVAVGVLANFLLWRYRLHLYELNTDYDREPLQSIQTILFRGTQAFIPTIIPRSMSAMACFRQSGGGRRNRTI